MSLRRFIGQLFSTGFGHRHQQKEQPYDNVEITNIADGTTIQGHDAVKAYFEREKKMYEAYGSSIFFQVYRINMQADTIKELQGEKLAEIKVDGDFVSGNDTVAAVKSRVRPLLEKTIQASREEETPPEFRIKPEDRITLFFNGRPMLEDKLFYADHFMMLPAWVQVFLHSCEFDKVAERAAEIGNADRG